MFLGVAASVRVFSFEYRQRLDGDCYQLRRRHYGISTTSRYRSGSFIFIATVSTVSSTVITTDVPRESRLVFFYHRVCERFVVQVSSQLADHWQGGRLQTRTLSEFCRQLFSGTCCGRVEVGFELHMMLSISVVQTTWMILESTQSHSTPSTICTQSFLSVFRDAAHRGEVAFSS